jgi:hypothetical protein
MKTLWLRIWVTYQSADHEAVIKSKGIRRNSCPCPQSHDNGGDDASYDRDDENGQTLAFQLVQVGLVEVDDSHVECDEGSEKKDASLRMDTTDGLNLGLDSNTKLTRR